MESNKENRKSKVTLSSYLTLEKEDVAGIIVIRLDGAIYIPEAEQFEKYMQQILDDHHFTLIINFEKVKQLPSLVFATIIQTYKRCKKMDGDLRLCSIPAALMRVFVTMQFDRIFKIFITEDEAVKSFHSSASEE